MDMGVQKSAPEMPQYSQYSVTVGPGPLGVALIADESKQFILVVLVSILKVRLKTQTQKNNMPVASRYCVFTSWCIDRSR
jgi:hypothetical protein